MLVVPFRFPFDSTYPSGFEVFLVYADVPPCCLHMYRGGEKGFLIQLFTTRTVVTSNVP